MTITQVDPFFTSDVYTDDVVFTTKDGKDMKHKWMMEVTLAQGEYSSITKRFTEIFTDAINKFGYFGEAVDTGGAQLRGALEALKEKGRLNAPVEALMDPEERRRLESARYLGFKTVAEFDEWEASHEDAAPKRLTETSSSDDPFAGPGPYGVSDAGNGQNILLWKVNTEKKYAVIKISPWSRRRAIRRGCGAC